MAAKRNRSLELEEESSTTSARPTSTFEEDAPASKRQRSGDEAPAVPEPAAPGVDGQTIEGTFDYGDPIHTERHIRIIVVGAGPSGLLLAYKLQRSFRKFSLILYEKNPEVSGTWFENRYPGCACDIPAHNYTYSFEPKHNWSRAYASSDEIKQYFIDFSAKYQLGKYIKLRHKVVGAWWMDERGEWRIAVKDLEAGTKMEETCDIFINAGGYLNDWDFPTIPGLDQFQGKLLHSAAWDPSFDLRGKRVALLGNGSSGVQILPAIQPHVSSLTFFMRSPTWILPPIGRGQHTFTMSEISQLEDPTALSRLRKANESIVNSYFSLYFQNSPLQRSCVADFTKAMFAQLPPHLPQHKFIPQWGVGCRRLTAAPDYLKSLSASNVTTIFGGVTALTPTGCIDHESTHHPADAIICATGFNTSYIPRFPIHGLDGLNLQDHWQTHRQPRSYMGIAADGFPNFFTLLGPYSPVANGPTLPGLEAQVEHVLAWLDRYQTERTIHAFSPRAAAVDDFLAHHAAFMRRTVWMHGCRSGYKRHTDGEGGAVLPLVWPGSTLHCREALRELRGEDWDIVYRRHQSRRRHRSPMNGGDDEAECVDDEGGGRFAWLGNGISQTEMDPWSDLGWYLKDKDDGAWGSRWKRREEETRTEKRGEETGSGRGRGRELFQIAR